LPAASHCSHIGQWRHLHQRFSDTTAPKDAVHHRPRLVVADVPANRIADVNRGSFVPLTNLADGDLTFTLEIGITNADGVLDRTLEQTIKETIRQIGARLIEETRS